MTLQSDFENLIEKLEDNLHDMGNTTAEFDATAGLMGLADEILNIPPTMTGIQLDTSITCVCPATASKNVPFNITGVLTATYDDTTQTDVDLSGVLQGATVEIYNGNTLLGTCTTGSDGSYTYSYTPSSTGTLSIKAVYDSANDYYDDTASNSSSVSVSVDVSSIALTVSAYDKNDSQISSPSSSAILSYVDEDYAVLTATVLDSSSNPVVGETVSFDVVDSSTGTVIENIDTDVTDRNGVASVTYYSKGTGDLYIKCSCNNIGSSSVTIHDYLQVPKFDGTETIYQINGTTSHSNGEMGGGTGYLSNGFDNTGLWELTAKIQFSGVNCAWCLFPYGATSRDADELDVLGFNSSITWFNSGTNNHQNVSSLSYNNYYDLTITKTSASSITVSIGSNTVTISNWNALSSSTLHIGLGEWGYSENVCTMKDVVVKPL